MAKYLVKFQPVDMFFFGQETKYRPKKKDGKIIFEADYFQKSAFFPQQTTVLGALRYLLLQKHGQIPIRDQATAEKLIGPESFNASQSGQQDFGIIKRISPVYLAVDEHFYMPAPKDICKREKEGNIVEAEKMNFDFENNRLPVIDNYSPKEGLFDGMVRLTSFDVLNYTKTDENKYDYVFVEVEKVGINKKQSEDAFYKQISCKPNQGKNIAFVVEAEIEEDGLENEVFHIPVGAEKHTFRVEFLKNKSLPEIKYQLRLKNNVDNPPAVLLISDTFVDDEANDLFSFSISGVKPFRYLLTKTGPDVKYGHFSVSKNRLQLFQRGSIFFFETEDNLNAFLDAIKQHENFVQIGYNHYLTLKNSKL